MSGEHDDAVISRQLRALEALLEERGVVSGKQLDMLIDHLLSNASPLNGARVIARAWTDADFKARLLADANTGLADLGYGRAGKVFRVVENTDQVHNVIVCTLCSCYPTPLLGPSPSWYASEAYRSRVVRDPRSVLAEFGYAVPDDVQIRVWDASAETRYMVLPQRPHGTEHMTQDELAQLVTRNGMIGTAAV